MKFFITGTGTDVGKTVIAAAVCDLLAKTHEIPAYWKPVQTGELLDSDINTVKRMCFSEIEAIPTQYSYQAPLSPDQAAEVDNLEPAQAKNLAKAYWELKKIPLVIEGAGGLQVPLNKESETWLDFLQETRIPTIVVASTGLGTLNHTILTVEALIGVAPIQCVVLNGPMNQGNFKSLQNRYPEICFIHFPILDSNWNSWPREATENLWNALRAIDEDDQVRTDDKEFCWHPFTQHKGCLEPIEINSAQGIWLNVKGGTRLVDATSSWWVNTIGHGRPEISRAVGQQQRILDHSIFAGATHKPATDLAKTIISKTNGDFGKVFFTDNGSCAVEVALKMAIQKWHNEGQPQRQKILSLHGSYHGDTFAAMATSQSIDFHSPFLPLIFKPLMVHPVTIHPTKNSHHGHEALEKGKREIDSTFNSHATEMAAVIVEPLVQGASGMTVQDPSWLEYLVTTAQSYGVPVIFDEVFTGMGRAGEYFAYQLTNIVPDILCLAKGLTGGNLPLALTLAKEEIFAAFYATENKKALFHGHSFTANPIGCAAALATLKIYEKDQIIARSQKISMRMQAWLTTALKPLKLQNPRSLGSIMAFEIGDSPTAAYHNSIREQVIQEGIKQGLLLRPLGNTVYLVPPLSITDEELEFTLDALYRTIESITTTQASCKLSIAPRQDLDL